MPGFARVNQFTRERWAFEKQTGAPGRQERLGERQQAGQRRERARRDDRSRPGGQAFDALGVDRDLGAGGARNLPEKLGLAPVGLDQGDPRDAEQRQDHTRKAGATAEVDQRAGGRRQMEQELRGIEDVPAPGIGKRRRTDQVDRPLPAAEQLEIERQPVQCFT